LLQITPEGGQIAVKRRSLAVLDLGSGTFRLVLYAYEPGRYFQLLDELREPVALGEGLSRGSLAPEALERGRKALKAFASFLEALKPDEVLTLATSAVRDAANGGVVLEEARRLGLQAKLLPGEEEARLGVLAVANALPFQAALVVDQGGGSAQVSLMEGRRFAFGRALPLGALRLTEAYLRSDPPRRPRSRPWKRRWPGTSRAFPAPGGFPWWPLGGTCGPSPGSTRSGRATPWTSSTATTCPGATWRTWPRTSFPFPSRPGPRFPGSRPTGPGPCRRASSSCASSSRRRAPQGST